MKGHLLQRVFHTLTEAFQNCMKRFPITVCFAFALSAFLIYLVATDMDGDRKRLFIWGYYLSIGTLLSLTLHLWNEELKGIIKKVAIQIVANVLLIADALFLYNYSSEQTYAELGIAHVAAILALWLSIFFLSFFKEKNDIPSWNFALNTITSFITANIVGYIMSGGISLLVLSLHMLFDVDVSGKCYAYIFIVCSVLLPTLLFLGMLPQGESKHNRQPQSLDFLNGIIRFLFMPLMGGYLLVLYIYTARILSNWELPIGWVSWLVVTLMAGCIAIEFGLYPTRMGAGKRTDERIARWLPALVLPLLMLMTVGIIRRFNDYGITINRLYLITLNIWFYIVCIGLILTKARRINWIPISFAIIFLLTSALPVNYASITKNTIRTELEEELKQTCDAKLPLSREDYNNWLASLPEKTAMEVNDKFLYIDDLFGRKTIANLVEKDVSFYTAKYHYESATDRENNTDTYVSYNGQVLSLTNIEIPNGYNRFIAIPANANKSDKNIEIPHKYVKTGVLPVSLGLQTGNENDTVYIDLKTLKELNECRYGEMKPTQFKCNTNKSLFILTGFSIAYDEQEDEDIRLSINGYLFKK